MKMLEPVGITKANFIALPARKFCGGYRGSEIVARNGLAHAARRFGADPAASMQHAINRRDANSRFARNISQS